jgi:hypothetical protein
LIIPDADVVIHLHELGIWDNFVRQNSVHLSALVVEEAHFYKQGAGESTRMFEIDLRAAISDGSITIINIDVSALSPMYEEAQKLQIDQSIDAGETETIAAAYSVRTDLTLCLIDCGAIRYATLIGLAPRCISVEEALNSCGLGRGVRYNLSNKRFKSIVKAAEQERVQLLADSL